jgi:dGTPase
MASGLAAALAAYRQCNYDLIYLRPESLEQARRVSVLLEALVECFAQCPQVLPATNRGEYLAKSADAYRASVTYVAGMTDRFAITSAQRLLDWPTDELPMSVGDASRLEV